MAVCDVITVAMTTILCLQLVEGRIIPERRKDTKEYCSTDAFHVSCGEHEVILMTSALYGRMQPGRCISGDYHHTVGCFTDVLTYMDSKCSGRRECMVIVGSLELVAQPCQKDFKAYLEASYKCVPVVQAQPELCQSVQSIPAPPPESVAFGRSTVHSVAGEAGTTCSWEVEVNAGQQVALILAAFPEPINLRHHPASVDANAAQLPSPVGHQDQGCPWEIMVHEGDKVTSVALCAADDRERAVYTSAGNAVTLSFRGNGNVDDIPYFLLTHKAVGCPDIEAPKRAWVRREKDNLVMKCNETGETWYLTCRHGEWIGDVGNCTAGTGVFPASRVFSESSIFQEGVIFAVIVGIVLGLLIGTSMLGVVFFCRKRWQMNGSQNSLQAVEAREQRLSTVKSSYPALLRQEKPIGGNVCEYTHVWEVRPTNMSSFKKDPEAQKLEDIYISSMANDSNALALTTTSAPTMQQAPGSICTQSMMGSHGIYEATNQRPCEKHQPQLCLAHDPLYFELDADGKRTCAV